MSIKALIFDVGGVLHSTENSHVYEDIKKTLQLNDEQFQSYRPLMSLHDIGLIDEPEFWRRFLQATGTAQKLPSESLLAREYKKRFKAHTEVLSIVKNLKKYGYQLAILSNTIPAHYNYNLEQGIFDDFAVRIFSHQVGLRKPDRKIYELVLSKLQVKPSEAIFIDDVGEYVEAARALGINGIQFKNADQLVADLTQLGVRCSP